MIYFIKSESGHVKIGHTDNDIESRLYMLQNGNPFKLTVLKTIDADSLQETLIHRKFKKYRCEGEWFLLNQEILEYINQPYTLKTKDVSKPNTRQGSWQQDKRKQGLCAICGTRPLAKKSTWYCEICLAKRRFRAQMNKLSKLF